MKSIDITVNGEPRQTSSEQTLGDLLAQLKLQPKYVAVELNERLVPRGQFGSICVQSGDRVEIVTLVGGG